MRSFQPFINQRLVAIAMSALCIPAVALAQTPTPAPSAAAQPHHFDWTGVYNGFLPCEDCQGIKTTLALNGNNDSYIMMIQYTGKSDREITEKGKFVWHEEDNTLILTPRKNGSSHQYLMTNDELIKLDDGGNRFTGKDAERYILRKTKMSPTKAGRHGGH